MSKADNMFKELGYKNVITKYSGKSIRNYIDEIGNWIIFDSLNKLYKAGCGIDPLDININLHLAIQEKLNELGWLDE